MTAESPALGAGILKNSTSCGGSRWLGTGLIVGLGAVAGCTGSIDPGGGSGDGAANSDGAAGPGSTSSSGSGGASGSTATTSGDSSSTDGGSTEPQPGVVTLDAGRTVLRRLTAPEYNNTVRDLLSTSLRPADDFTDADTVAVEGFDTLGAVLSLPPVLVEQYEGAARALVDELFARPQGDSVKASLLSCDTSDEACVRAVLEAFAARAFRRPVDGAELDRLLSLRATVDALGGPAEDSMKAALVGVLLSPHFLFRVERLPPGDTSARQLSSYEIATRLAYFLWSSMPDEELSQLAESGTLVDNLGAQVERLLSSDKASELAVNFGGQWLGVRHMEELQPPSQLVYPDYDEALGESAKQETLLFFEELVIHDAPLQELLTADYSIIDTRLGQHYGVAVNGDGFSKVTLTDTPRRGFLTHASFLMNSSHPGSTSPARRGELVLDRLMCDAVPPPPPGVEVDLPPPEPGMTRREQLELHRAAPSCANCHNALDPIGFGFENFDGVGAYRTEENAAAIDASGVLTTSNGEVAFTGPVELASLLAADPRYAACVTEKLLTYAVGRSFAASDAKAYTAGITQAGISEGKSSWRSWIEHIVRSEAFLTGRGEAQ